MPSGGLSAVRREDFDKLPDGPLTIKPLADDPPASPSQFAAPDRVSQKLLDGRRQRLGVLLGNEDAGVAGLDQFWDARYLRRHDGNLHGHGLQQDVGYPIHPWPKGDGRSDLETQKRIFHDVAPAEAGSHAGENEHIGLAIVANDLTGGDGSHETDAVGESMAVNEAL